MRSLKLFVSFKVHSFEKERERESERAFRCAMEVAERWSVSKAMHRVIGEHVENKGRATGPGIRGYVTHGHRHTRHRIMALVKGRSALTFMWDLAEAISPVFLGNWSSRYWPLPTARRLQGAAVASPPAEIYFRNVRLLDRCHRFTEVLPVRVNISRRRASFRSVLELALARERRCASPHCSSETRYIKGS